jgi:hypothetical protein
VEKPEIEIRKIEIFLQGRSEMGVPGQFYIAAKGIALREHRGIELDNKG